MHAAIKGGRKGERRQGGQKGKGSGYGKQYDFGLQQKVMHVPKKAVGLVLGTGGRNIKALQAAEGIRSVWLETSTGTLTICGTEDSVASVASQVEHHINASLVGGNDVEFAVTLVDVGSSGTGTIGMVRAKDAHLPVELSDSAPGREYFVFCLGPPRSLEEQVAALSLSRSNGDSHEHTEEIIGSRGRMVFGVDHDGYAKEFDSVLAQLSSVEPGSRVRTEARYGVMLFAFPPAGLAAGHPMPQAAFSRLQLHKDLQPRFFGTLQAEPVDRIKKFLLSCGFISVPPEERKVVHLIDINSKLRLSITLAELEDGTDARIGDEGKAEIDRIAACRNYYQVLGLEAGCCDQDVKKAYYRLAKLVHPDKNGHAGAESAMKSVIQCKDALEDEEKRSKYGRSPVAPPAVEKNFTGTKLKVVKCHSGQRKHLQMHILKPFDELGVRAWVRSYRDHRHDGDLLRFLDDAWAKQSDGMLTAENSNRYRVDTVRYKTRYRFTDGDIQVIIEHVRQKDIGLDAHDRWEVEVRSRELKEAMKSVSTLRSVDRHSLRTHFHDFISKVSALGAAMTSNATRMIADLDTRRESLHRPVELH